MLCNSLSLSKGQADASARKELEAFAKEAAKGIKTPVRGVSQQITHHERHKPVFFLMALYHYLCHSIHNLTGLYTPQSQRLSHL